MCAGMFRCFKKIVRFICTWLVIDNDLHKCLASTFLLLRESNATLQILDSNGYSAGVQLSKDPKQCLHGC